MPNEAPQSELRATGIFQAGVGMPSLRQDGPFPRIVGYAAMFNVRSELIMGMFREIIRPGAFKNALAAGQDVRGLVDHDPSKILGRTKSGTLRLEEDNVGLRYEIDPPDTAVGRDILVSMRRGDVDQSSFGFRIRKGGDKWEENGKELVREVTDVDLFDVSVVTYPAYPQTSVQVRSLWPGSTTEEQISEWVAAHRPVPERAPIDRRRRLRLHELSL